VLLTVDLLAGDALDVDHPLLAVHLSDLALTALRETQHDSSDAPKSTSDLQPAH
jgi:hypothetical protein